MPDIVSITTADILQQLPQCEECEAPVVADGALLIACAGFEERSLAVLRDVDVAGIKAVVLIQYPTNKEDNREAAAAFEKAVDKERLRELRYDRKMFLHDVKAILAEQRDRGTSRVLVDISGMASYVIYRVLGAIWDVVPQHEVVIYYAEAADYSPSKEEWETFYASVSDPHDRLAMAARYEDTYFQARGVSDTYECEVFPGRNIGGRATEVVAIPSFSLQRMKSMLAYAEAQYNVPEGNITWFLGRPPDEIKNGWRYDALAALYNVEESGLSVSTWDYRDVLRRLESLWEEVHIDRHVVIAGMGSKMQHVGSFMFLAVHPECGLLLCEPESFIADRYTSGIGARWCLKFGVLGEMKKLLESRGELRFVWDKGVRQEWASEAEE